MQKMVQVYSFRLESSGVQQESTVVGREKYYTLRRRTGLCCLLHQISIEQDKPLKEDGRFSGFLKSGVAEDTSVNTGHVFR
jgi:hypothetical protein